MKAYATNNLLTLSTLIFFMGLAPLSQAAVPAEEAAKLGKELTPIGAERAGNGKEGPLAIPEWTGDYSHIKMDDSDWLVEGYPDDDEILELDKDNYQDYAEYLTEGQKALFKQYPDTYKMEIYPSRRSAVFPERIYEETIKNASRAELDNNGHGIKGTIAGLPFPIPKSGYEVMWNHIARFRTTGFRGYVNRGVTTASGSYSLERTYFEIAYHFNNPNLTEKEINNKLLYVMAKTVAPASKVGEAALLHVPLDRVKEDTNLWVYNFGTRKVRRIGEVGYDEPFDGADGLMTHDQLDMFNGPMDRYQFKIIGKQEKFVSYNSYDVYSKDTKYDDLIRKGHINQDIPRYELHRVWVVEATRLPDTSHVYSKRVFYLDEDSWLILLQDMYDDRGEFWRTADTHANVFYQIPLLGNPVQVHYDLQSRRYVILNMTNEEKKPIVYNWFEPPSYFTTSKLKKFATTKQKL